MPATALKRRRLGTSTVPAQRLSAVRPNHVGAEDFTNRTRSDSHGFPTIDEQSSGRSPSARSAHGQSGARDPSTAAGASTFSGPLDTASVIEHAGTARPGSRRLRGDGP